MACIWLVGKTGLGGDRFLTPFASVIDEEVVMVSGEGRREGGGRDRSGGSEAILHLCV